MSDELVPSDIFAEKAVLGIVILDPDRYDDVSERLVNNDFYDTDNKLVYRAIGELRARNKAIDYITIVDRIKKITKGHSDLVTRVGAASIMQLTSSVPDRISDERLFNYCHTIKAASVARRVGLVANAIVRDVTDPSLDVETILHEAEERILNLNTELHTNDVRVDEGGFTMVADLIPDMLTQFGQMNEGIVTGVPTGMPEIDDQLDGGGLQPKAVYFLGAMEKTGKTSLLLDWAMHIALKTGTMVPIVTLEMSKLAMTKRLFSKFSGIPYYRFRAGFAGKQYEQAFDDAVPFAELPISIADGLFSTEQIERHLKRLVEAGKRNGKPVKVAIIDYLQLIQLSGVNKGMNREAEVSKISIWAKRLASSLDISLVIVSNLNRSGMSEGAVPSTLNLRDSGQLAFDAEAVFFLHNPSYIPGKPYQRKNVTDINFIIAVQRNGPVDTIGLKFIGKIMSFLTANQFTEKYGSWEEAEEIVKVEQPPPPMSSYWDTEE